MKTLYSKSSTGALLLWQIAVDGASYIVTHGQLNGKMQTKVTKTKAKNTGKLNATTPEQQAIVESDAKFELQKKKGYYLTKEEALSHIECNPMTLQKWAEHADKITYPCHSQHKLNGSRFLYTAAGDGVSKSGEPVSFPKHIQDEINVLVNNLNEKFRGFDGEMYSGLISEGGLSLQRIISAFRKPNADTPRIQYHIYDICDPTETFGQRAESLEELKTLIKQLGLNHIVTEMPRICLSKNDVEDLFKQDVAQGYEGSVARNRKGMYTFGKRSYDNLKLKPRQTCEAKVISVEEDKSAQGVLNCKLENGVEFKCLMKKDSALDINLRLYNNALSLVNKFIEIEFEELSDVKEDGSGGKPLKPAGVRVREVNSETWEPKD